MRFQYVFTDVDLGRFTYVNTQHRRAHRDVSCMNCYNCKQT